MGSDHDAEIRASVGAHHDLGPGYDDAVAEGLVDRIGAEIDKRIEARLRHYGAPLGPLYGPYFAPPGPPPGPRRPGRRPGRRPVLRRLMRLQSLLSRPRLGWLRRRGAIPHLPDTRPSVTTAIRGIPVTLGILATLGIRATRRPDTRHRYQSYRPHGPPGSTAWR